MNYTAANFNRNFYRKPREGYQKLTAALDAPSAPKIVHRKAADAEAAHFRRSIADLCKICPLGSECSSRGEPLCG